MLDQKIPTTIVSCFLGSGETTSTSTSGVARSPVGSGRRGGAARLIEGTSIIAVASILGAIPAHAEEPAQPTAEARESTTEATTTSDEPPHEVILVVGRLPRRAEDSPQVVEVIDRDTIEHTAAEDLTDALKKNASVDVIQYPGALSGIGMRGFRPEFSGTTKHSLLLVDGRPAGASNLATVPLTSIEQIEVLHGPASAIYGGEAVGGVVNIVRRRSVGPIGGGGNIGYGSAQSWQAEAFSGGNATAAIDFDVAGRVDLRAADMRLGDGTTRPNTEYETYFGRTRARLAATKHWSVELDGDASIGRDIETPGDVFYGTAQQSRKDLERGGVALTAVADWDAHTLTMVGYHILDNAAYTDLPEAGAAYRSHESDLGWLGGQLRYIGHVGHHHVAAGVDLERISSESRSFAADGTRRAPFSPDNRRSSAGVYTQVQSAIIADRLLATYGVRADLISLSTLETEYKTDFEPGTADFTTINPNVGLQGRWRGLRPHASVGTAFVPPQAAQMAGYAEREVEGVTMSTLGNPDLDPERAWSVDAGLGYLHTPWGVDADATIFVTRVADKIDRQMLSNTETTYANVGTGRIEGWQGHVGLDLGALLGWRQHLRPTVSWTHIWRAEEGDGEEATKTHNVARWNVRYGLEAGGARWSARALARYRGTMRDTDWNAAGYPEIVYPTWTIFDVVARVRVAERQHVSFEARNVTDRHYYEKRGFPLMGRSFFIRYGLTL